MDTVFIREFRVDAWVGVYDWEKQRAQTLEMDIEIGLLPMARRTENIHETVNYGEVVERVKKELADRKFRLLEALAEHLCDVILANFRVATSVRLSVAKIGHVRGVRKLGITLERRREGA
jgi:dihydroneopterin aldolase